MQGIAPEAEAPSLGSGVEGSPAMRFSRIRRTDHLARRTRRLAALRPSAEALEGRALLAAFHWAADVSGPFNDPGNWRDANDEPGIPGANDDATIGFADVTVTSAENHDLHSLTSSG